MVFNYIVFFCFYRKVFVIMSWLVFSLLSYIVWWLFIVRNDDREKGKL